MVNKVKSILNSDFKKNVATLMSGIALAQLAPLLASPLLTRMFSPENFGQLAIFIGISAILSIFGTGRYELAIFIPKENKTAINVLALSVGLSIAFTAIIVATIFTYRLAFAGSITIFDELGLALFFVPLGVLLNANYRSFGYWINRIENYKELAFSKVIRGLGITFTSLGLGFLGFSGLGLIIGDLVGMASAVLYLTYCSHKSSSQLRAFVNINEIKNMAKSYYRFPKFGTFSASVEMTATHIPTFLLTSFYGTEITGFFALTQRVITTPVSFISRSLGDVFRQRASQLISVQGRCDDLFKKTLFTLLKIAFVPAIVLLFASPMFFKFFFGGEWITSGQYAQVMSLVFLFQFATSPLSSMFTITEHQKSDLYLQLFLLSSLVLAFIASQWLGSNPIYFIYLLATTYCFKYLIELYLSYQYSKPAIHTQS